VISERSQLRIRHGQESVYFQLVESSNLNFLDHPLHSPPILGGMWGFQNHKDKRTASKIFNQIKSFEVSLEYNKIKNERWMDQIFLQQKVFHRINHIALIHLRYLRGTSGTAEPAEPFLFRWKVNFLLNFLNNI
jgi:hypothetical protein